MRRETVEETKQYLDALAGNLPGDSWLSRFYAERRLMRLPSLEYDSLVERTNRTFDRYVGGGGG